MIVHNGCNDNDYMSLSSDLLHIINTCIRRCYFSISLQGNPCLGSPCLGSPCLGSPCLGSPCLGNTSHKKLRGLVKLLASASANKSTTLSKYPSPLRSISGIPIPPQTPLLPTHRTPAVCQPAVPHMNTCCILHELKLYIT